jgi:hypothetical protein
MGAAGVAAPVVGLQAPVAAMPPLEAKARLEVRARLGSQDLTMPQVVPAA